MSLITSACSVDLQHHFSATETQMRQDWPQTDFSQRSVSLDEITYQALPKDAIPAIDKPVFKNISAIGWIAADEPVIVIEAGNTAKAYPLQIMIHHEIVNDTINGEPIAVTFCPLCNASIVYSRKLDSTVLDFSVSGSLRKSDMIMYDRQTQSWWQQFTGVGIVGAYNKVKLTRLPSRVIAYQDFVAAFPQGKVLSRETGFSRQYGENPYRGYDNVSQSPFLYFDPHDKRLAPMVRVLAISTANQHRVYPLPVIKQRGIINDNFADLQLVVFSKEGMLSAVDAQWIEDSRRIPAAVAYNRRYCGRHFSERGYNHRHNNCKTLTFKFNTGEIVDEQTNSRWNILGHAVDGPLQGAKLTPVDRGVHFAFAWLGFRPESEVYAIDQ